MSIRGRFEDLFFAAWLRDRNGPETAVFLTPKHRKALIACAEPYTRAFLRPRQHLTVARPKELASAAVEDFDDESVKLAHRKGKPPKLRVRHVVLSAEGIKFFEHETAGKLPKHPIFTENGRQPWRRHIWARQFRAAADKVNEEARGKARIPPQATTYSFRHARISELLQIHGIDPSLSLRRQGHRL